MKNWWLKKHAPIARIFKSMKKATRDGEIDREWEWEYIHILFKCFACLHSKNKYYEEKPMVKKNTIKHKELDVFVEISYTINLRCTNCCDKMMYKRKKSIRLYTGWIKYTLHSSKTKNIFSHSLIVILCCCN